MRKHGMLGRGNNVNQIFSIAYDCLPPEARTTIQRIITNGPFPEPGKDGSLFENRFGDLPEGQYFEYTAPTPGVKRRGRRRIVARKKTGQVFFTACHYDRVSVKGGNEQEQMHAMRAATKALDPQWQNGFYIVTGMTADMRNHLVSAIKAIS